MERLDKKYMLFIFGDYSLSDEFVNEITHQFVGIISSKYMKFNYGEYGMVCYFRSLEAFEDLKEYFDMCLNDVTNQYFFIEVGDNVDIKMDSKLKKDFLNIDGDEVKNKNGFIEIEKIKHTKPKIEFDELYNIMFPIMDENFFKKQKIVEEPSVDQILDKITEKGINSLTKKEIEILNNYGNKSNG